MATKTDLRVVLGVDGEQKFSATMKKLGDQQKIIRAETKNAASALKDGGTEYEKARIKAEGLTKQIEQQEKKVKALKDAYETTCKNQKVFAEAVDKAKSDYETANEALKKMEDTAKKAGATEDELKEKFKAQRESVGELKKEYEAAESRVRANNDANVDFKIKLENASASLNNMRSSLEKANQKMVENEGKSEKLVKGLKEIGTNAEKAGEKMEKTGEKMSKYLTTGILTAGAAASKAAVDYEEAFAGVVKTVDGTETELSELNKQILDMSTTLPSSATEIAGVAEAAGQLGIGVNDINDFTEVMVKLGMSTNLSAEEAATSLAKFTNITKMSAEDYDKLGATIVDLGNNFATTESDIVEMTTRLASTGEITGKTEPQMLAIATALSSVGIEAEAGGSAISKLMKKMDLSVQTYDTAKKTIEQTGMSLRDLEMLANMDSSSFKGVAKSLGMTTTELKTMMSNAKSLEQFSDVAGVTADEFIQAYGKDSVSALGMFIDGLDDTEKQGKNAVEILQDMGLTEVRLSNAVLALSSSEGILNKAVDTANSAWNENAALQTEVDKRLETTGSKMKLAKNELTKTAIIMGDNFLPTIAELAGKVGELAEKFGALDKDTQKSIAKFALIVAAAGPTIKVFGKLTTGIGKTAQSASKLIRVTKEVKAGTYTGPLNKVLSALLKTNSATGNLAASSSSLAGMLGSSGPLIIAFVAAAAAAAGLYAAYRKLTEGDRAVTEGVEKMLSGFGKWDETVSNATNLLSGLNSEIIVSSEKSAAISQEMDIVQKDITTIAQTASDERRKLTEAEIQRLEDLFKKMSELSTQELQIQQAYQDAAITMAQTTSDYSYENCADMIKSAQDAKDQTIQLAKQQQAEKLLLLQQTYEVEGTMTAEEYEQQKQAAQQEYDLAVQSANDKFAKVNEIVTQGYFEQNIKGNEQLQNLINLDQQFRDNEQQHEDELARIASDANLTADQKRQEEILAWSSYYKKKNDIQDQMEAEMENLNNDELAAWVEMSANTELYGGEISDENKQIFDEFIGTYDNLPKKAKKKFQETMQGMIDGIKEKSSALYEKASEIADGFISKIQKKFDIHSPSRVMKKMFGHVVEGGVIGVEENKQKLFDEAEETASGFLDRFADLPAGMRESVEVMRQRVLNQMENAAYMAAQLKKRAQAAGIISNVSTTHNDNSAHFDAILKIENLSVRNDNDIRKLSNQIESLTRNALIGKGKRV